jgi:hypothetical protein
MIIHAMVDVVNTLEETRLVIANLRPYPIVMAFLYFAVKGIDKMCIL